jgi:phosphoglycerol transferase MdoB-like AlkP superfamily enzyme
MEYGRNGIVKLIFGGVIFLFSLALAYFTANYVDQSKDVNYWFVLFCFTVIYMTIAITVYKIFSISLGFLFACDVLIINLLFENFGEFQYLFKMAILAIALIVLYCLAWLKLKDGETQLPDKNVPPIA